MTENEFLLQDRITKIQSINQLHNLNDKGYISYSGGKDSTVLSYLVDLALPGNKIPRVYINTGIEYRIMTDYIHQRIKEDDRIIEIFPKINIKTLLETKGYPFKSKEYAQKLRTYQNVGMTKTPSDYLGLTGHKAKSYQCPDTLKYQFTPDFKLKVSDLCCTFLKKKPISEFESVNLRPIRMTGMRSSEGGIRKSHSECTVFSGDLLTKFHPLKPLKDDFIDWFIEKYQIKLCDLYYPPYNFERTGCAGCPFNMNLQKDLDLMAEVLPAERKRCEILWKPVYEEYRRIGYRLRKE